MFKIHIGNTPNSLTPVRAAHTILSSNHSLARLVGCWQANLAELGKLTEGYSGSDISVLVRDALYEPVRTCQV